MKELLEFLTKDDVKATAFFKKLECLEDEALIIRGLLSHYFNGSSFINAYQLLSSIWQGFTYLEKVGLVQKLQDLNLISINPPKEGLGVLHCDLQPSPNLLSLLEAKSLKLSLEKAPFADFNSYLHFQFNRLDLIARGKLVKEKKQKEKLIKELALCDENLKLRLSLSKESNPLEELFKEFKLDYNESLIILALLRQEYTLSQNGLDAKGLLGLCSGPKMPAYLKENSKLMQNQLIEYEELFMSDFTKVYFLSGDVVERVLNPKKKLANKLQALIKEQEIFELIKPTVSFDDIIMQDNIKATLESILKQKDKKVVARLAKWGVKNTKEIEAKLIFYGSPGTGKTMSALALAKALKKPLLNFDCSKILSKYVGESEQNVRKVFDEYKRISAYCKQAPILLLNEADQFLSTRSSGGAGAEKMHNQMQNIFLEQIEKFSGILIATTNFLEGLDLAFSRRFEYKLEFKRPSEEARFKLWEMYLPKNAPYDKDFCIKKLSSYPLSGAQIKLVVKNTAFTVASNDGIFTNQAFVKNIEKEINSSFDREKTMGFVS